MHSLYTLSLLTPTRFDSDTLCRILITPQYPLFGPNPQGILAKISRECRPRPSECVRDGFFSRAHPQGLSISS